MRLHICCLFWVLTNVAKAQNVYVDQFQDMLEKAANEVLGQHTHEMARLKPPPAFDMPPDFMRSFVPNTGVGNREELILTNIKQIPVYDDANFTQYRYKRFNNTDYVIGKTKHRVLLNKVDATQDEFFVFTVEDAILNFETDYWSLVKDVVMFTRLSKNSEFLYVAILTETSKTSIINIHEIVGNKGILVAAIDLGVSATTSYSPIKIGYVQSQLAGSLVVLIGSVDVPRITYRQKGSRELNHYIEIHYPYAVDLVTFTVLGRAYVAVANHEVVEIYKIDSFLRSHLLFDRIHTSGGLTGLEYFRLGFHHYLVITGFEKQLLYNWNSGEFSLKQEIAISGVKQVYAAVLASCRDDVILIFIGDGSVSIYIYSGADETFMAVSSVVPTFDVQPESITSIPYKSNVILLFSNGQSSLQAFEIETSLKPMKDPILKAGEEMSEIMKNIKDQIESQSKQVKAIKDVLANAVRSKGDQIITAEQTFNLLESSGEASIKEIMDPIFIEWEGSNLTMEEHKRGAENLEKDVDELERLITEIEKIIPDVVRVDQPTLITGQKVFTGDIEGSSIVALSLNLESASNVNLKEIQKELYRLDRPQQIKGTLSFQKPLTVKGNLDVAQTVNGIDISEQVMTTNTKQTSHAQITFKNKMVIDGDLDITGTVNQIDIGNEVVTLNGNHKISGRKSFMNGIIADSVNTELLDGIDMNYMFANAFTISGDQNIPGVKTFKHLISNDIALHGTLNGFNVTELASNIVRIDQPSIITGHKTFLNDVVIDGDLFLDGTINGLKIPDDLFLTDVTQVVTGSKEFTGTVTAHTVTVSGAVDGLKIPDDIVTLSRDETVQSTLYFTHGISVEKDIIVEGLVDGVDISELAKEALKLNETNEFNNAVFFGPVTITGNLDVGGLVNTVNLKELAKDIVYKDEYPIVINSEKRFKKVVADTVKVANSINGFNIEKDFMRVRGDQNISGTKTFRKPVVFNTVVVDNDAISGINVSKIYEDQITLAIQDGIDNDIEFVDHVIVEGDLLVGGSLDGLKIPGDIVLRNSNQAIENKIFQKHVKVDNLIVDGDADVSGTFGGINLSQFYQDRITLTGDQEIDGDVWISNVTAARVSISGLVNGINITDFANNVMSKTKDQEITAMKTFSGRTTVFGPITTREGINGVNLTDLKRRAFKLHEDNVVTAPLEFSDITVQNLIISDGINGVNLTRLNEDSLKKYELGLQHVKGITIFNNGFHVDGDIQADTINELFLPNDILLKSVPQSISGQFTVGSLGIGGNLDIGGLINGMDLSEMAPLLARIDKEAVIESNITFTGPIHVFKDLDVTGLVNGVDLKQLFNTVLQKSGDQVIRGHKTFRGNVIIRGDMDVQMVNGVDWSNFLDDVVFIDKMQTIAASKTFSDTEVKGDVFVTGEARVGKINGQDLRTFLDDVVYIDEPANITGPIVFQNPVEISGNMDAELINGLRLKTDVITIECSDDGPQLITGQKTFQNITVYADVIAATVNSYDLQALYLDTLLNDGNQTVTGRKVLTGETVFQANVHPTTVNGMVLRNDLVTLNTDQEIDGPLTFEGDVFVEKDLHINGLLNSVDLKQLANEAVYLDTDQVIKGSYSIENAIANSDVAVGETVNGMDLVGLDRNITEFWMHATQSLKDLEVHSEDTCELANYLQDYLKKSYHVLDGFVVHQKLDFPASFVQVESQHDVTLVYLTDSFNVAYAVKNNWDDSLKKFLPSVPEKTSITKRWSLRVQALNIEILIGTHSKDSLVHINGQPGKLPGGFKDAAIVTYNNQTVVALLSTIKGVCDVYKISLQVGDSENPVIESYGSVTVGKEATSLALFEMSTTLYLAVSSSHAHPFRQIFSRIYARRNNDWTTVQNIAAASSTYVKHFLYHDYHYLAFTNSAPVYETREPKSIQIYRNSGPNKLLFSLFQKIPFDDAKGVEVFQFGDLFDLYVAAWNETVIQVFRLEGEAGLQSSIILHGNCIRDVKPLFINKELYLVVGQQNLLSDGEQTSVLFKGISKGSFYLQHKFTYC